SEMNRFFVLSLLVVAGLAVSSDFAVADISYSENFATTGVQATANGATFANYPDWTYYGNYPSIQEANVAAAGTLQLVSNNDGVEIGGPINYATISAQTIAGQSTFNLSTHSLTVFADV